MLSVDENATGRALVLQARLYGLRKKEGRVEEVAVR